MGKQLIFLCVGSCSDTIVLNESPGEVPKHKDKWYLTCCAPSGKRYTLMIKDICGCVVEIDRLLEDKCTSMDCLPVGSLVTQNWVFGYCADKYIRGQYNESIKKVMGAFGITDYCLPGRKQKSVSTMEGELNKLASSSVVDSQ